MGTNVAGKSHGSPKMFSTCDERRDLKKKRYEAEGAKEYRDAHKTIQKAVKKAKEDWIGAQCKETETCLNKKQQQKSISAGKESNLRERE